MTTAIFAALNNHLDDFAATEEISVAWENVDFNPTADVPYLRAFVLPASSVTIGVSDNSSDSHRGIYQVDCVYPSGSGWGAAKTMAGMICSYFRRQTIDGVKIINVTENKGISDLGRYIIPVSLTYVSFSKEVTE
jgi:hypothetical protein